MPIILQSPYKESRDQDRGFVAEGIKSQTGLTGLTGQAASLSKS